MKIAIQDISLKLMFNNLKIYNYFSFLPEIIELNKWKNLHDKKENVTYIRNSKQALFLRTNLEKMCIELLNQINKLGIKTELKNDFEKFF